MVAVPVLDALAKVATAFPLAPGPMLGRTGGLNPGWRGDTAVQGALEAIVKARPDLHPFSFAVVDLTDDPAEPRYAGVNDTDVVVDQKGHRGNRDVGSLAKVVLLYGAYQLRADLRVLSSRLGISDLTELATTARAEYSRIDASTSALPLIESMFALGAPGDVEFKSAPLSDAALAIEDVQYTGLRHNRTAPCLRTPCDCKNRRTVLTDPAKVAFELADIPMREHLRLTVGWSNNVSAAIVAHALGFKYVWALTRRSGLTRPIWPPVRVNETRIAGPSGLFLRKDFNCFRPRPPADAPAGPAAGGTARSAAMLMTVLAQGKLIDHAAHVGMGEMLRRVHPGFDIRGNGGEWSPTGKGFSDAGWIANQPTWHFDPATLPSAATYATWPLAISKIGWEPGEVLADAIIVRAKRPRMSGPDSFTTAVVVAIGPDDVGALQDFGSALATALDAEHL